MKNQLKPEWRFVNNMWVYALNAQILAEVYTVLDETVYAYILKKGLWKLKTYKTIEGAKKRIEKLLEPKDG